MAAAAVAAAGAASAAAVHAAPAAPAAAEVRDMYGFSVKAEFRELYQRFAPIYVAEEAERSERWFEFLAEVENLLPSLPGEDEVARLHRLLDRLGDAGRSDSGAVERGSQADTAGEPPLPPPAQAAALLQRLASLVQAGLPMAKRGAFWRLFLNVASKRKEGEYERLVADVVALEQRLGADRDSSSSSHENHGSTGGAGGAATPMLPGAAKLAAAAAYDAGQYGSGQGQYGVRGHTPAGVFNLVADASDRAGNAGAPAGAPDQGMSPPRRQLQQHHRVSTFRIIPLEDESPGATQDESATNFASNDCGYEETAACTPGSAVAAPASTPPPPCSAAQPTPAALMTPASTLQTPLTSSSRGTDGGASSGGPPSTGASLTGAAERWRQQEWLAQIDKDLHRTFPGHPSMDASGRAMLRRILSAYARRNPAVGYCQGLNFLGATFLLFMPEEDAFWSLCALIEDVLGQGYFDERMVPVQVDVLVFGHLLQGRFPTLWGHLQALDVDAASVTMHWFLCCFLNSLPLDSTLRVWDQLFFEGSPVVLFRVALALVEIYDQALMCTRDSSDAYVLLQVCAQMTFDSSRLVDTAACGYSHLQPAGLAALRSRYQGEVIENLRCAFPSDTEPEACATGQDGAAPDGSADGSNSNNARPSFGETFRRLSSALLEAEEAFVRQQAQQERSSGSDGGHLLPASSSRGGSWAGSWRGSPSSRGSGGSSPLAKVQQAVRGLTSRLMPSSLPALLPAGAMNESGQELAPMGAGAAGGGSSRGAAAAARAAATASVAAAAEQQRSAAAAPNQLVPGRAGAEAMPALALRRISVGERGGAAAADSSPTAKLSLSAGNGAALGRLPGSDSRLTPFSEVDAVLSDAQQQQDGIGLPCGDASTPQRLPALPGAAELRTAAGAGALPPTLATVAQSQPATPAAHLLDDLPPLASQRRVQTAGHPTAGSKGHARRRRHLTLDLMELANMRPNLQQPAAALAFAIAANPSPRAPGAHGRSSSGSSGCSVTGLGAAAGAAACVGHDAGMPGGCDAGSSSCCQELLLPIRALQFDEQETGGPEDPPGMRRSVSAPPAGLLLPEGQAAAEPGSAPADAAGAAAGHSSAGPASQGLGTQCSPLGIAAGEAASSSPVLPGRHAQLGSGSSSSGGAKQQQQQWGAVVAQLQEEVAVAESRRHEAEQDAAAQQQMVTDLQQQLHKVQHLVAGKEALVAELSSRLEAAGGRIVELGGDIAARQLAVEAEEAAQERRRRQIAAADALIQRLMNAVAQMQVQAGRNNGCGATTSSTSASGGSANAGGAGSASIGTAASVASASSGSMAGSPQSSIGSVALGPSRWGSGGTPTHAACNL